MAKPFSVIGRLVASGLFLSVSLVGGTAAAHQADEPAPAVAAADPAAPPAPYAPPPAGAPTAPVPPAVEQAPVALEGGGYCYAGSHPVDPRFAAGATWHETSGRHIHTYAPIDLRLFATQDGCYSFIGDPTDFGYQGQTYAYYGAHPVAPGYGHGWCFMIGGHAHGWRPWSPYFVVAGPWFYWHGPYDPFFWNYWPYYAVYYRHYYPRYYHGGRFARGGWGHHGRGGYAVAPAIGRVAAPPVSAPAAAAGGGAWGVAPAQPRGWGQGRTATPAPARWPGASVPSDSWRAPVRPTFTSPSNGWGVPSRAVPAPSGWGGNRSARQGVGDAIGGQMRGWGGGSVGGHSGAFRAPGGGASVPRGGGGWRR